MKSKYSITLLLLALIGTNIYWMYTVLDQGVTQTYMESSIDSVSKQYEQAVALSNLRLIGLDTETAISKIGKDVYGLDPFIKEGCIWAGQVCVYLNDGKVARIGDGPI